MSSVFEIYFLVHTMLNTPEEEEAFSKQRLVQGFHHPVFISILDYSSEKADENTRIQTKYHLICKNVFTLA